ncbi:hypothetical protein CHS0354_022043 [Potamilus streckersoni]|uniref:Fatty acid hydroxylase domain-containing protein n=1 Tax=Potamilus streckersoni TaxID=2493646 RepID=A0AAE0SRY9_9BIVA|nr:hypothetical protein CHS0354_022043 [Potamilus streckersoni]
MMLKTKRVNWSDAISKVIAMVMVVLLATAARGEWLLILAYLGKGYEHDLIHVVNITQDQVSSFRKSSPLSSIGVMLEYYYMRDLHSHIAMSVITSFVIFYGMAWGFQWYFYVRQRNKAEEWKCQPNKWMSMKEKRNEVLLGSFNLLIGSTISGCLSCYMTNGGKNSLYTNISEYGWTYLVVTVFALMMYNETCAYYLHLLLHKPYVYKTIHKWHHHYGSPTVFSTTAMHPAEFISFQIYLIVPAFTVPLHVGVYIAVVLYIYYYGMIGHSGIKMDALWPWQPSSMFHDDHHRYSNCNYGFNTFIFDKLHGTLRRKDQGCR